jgi:hypothetical protein
MGGSGRIVDRRIAVGWPPKEDGSKLFGHAATAADPTGQTLGVPKASNMPCRALTLPLSSMCEAHEANKEPDGVLSNA